MLKRCIAMLLAVAMCMSLLPVTALGAEVESEISELGGVAETTPEQGLEIEIPEENPVEPETEAAETEAVETEAAETEAVETEAVETEPAETEETEAVLCVHGAGEDCAVCALESRIAALPQADALAALSEEEKAALLEELSALLEAYDALSEEEKTLVAGYEKVTELYAALTVQKTAVEEAYGEISASLDGWMTGNDTDDEYSYVFKVQMSESVAVIKTEFSLSNSDGTLLDKWSVEGATKSEYPIDANGVGGDLSCYATVTLENGETVQTEPYTFRYAGKHFIDRIHVWGSGSTSVGGVFQFGPVYDGDNGVAANATYTWTLEKKDGNGEWADAGMGTLTTEDYPGSFTMDTVGTYRCKLVYRIPGAKPAVYTEYSDECYVLSGCVLDGIYTEATYGIPGEPIPFRVWFSEVDEGGSLKLEVHQNVQDDDGEKDVVVCAEDLGNVTEFTWTPKTAEGDEPAQTGNFTVTAVYTNSKGEVSKASRWMNVIGGGLVTGVTPRDCPSFGSENPSVPMGAVTFDIEAEGAIAELSYEVQKSVNGIYQIETRYPLEAEDREFTHNFTSAGYYRVIVYFTNEDGESGITDLFLSVEEADADFSAWVEVGNDNFYFDKLESVYFNLYFDTDEPVFDHVVFTVTNEIGEFVTTHETTGTEYVFTPTAGGTYYCDAEIYISEEKHFTAENSATAVVEYGPRIDYLYANSRMLNPGGTIKVSASITGGYTAGNGTFTWQLKKANENEDGTFYEYVGDPVVTTSGACSFTIKEAGEYEVDVIYRNSDGGVFLECYSDISVKAGLLIADLTMEPYYNVTVGEEITFQITTSGSGKAESITWEIVDTGSTPNTPVYTSPEGTTDTTLTWTPQNGGHYMCRVTMVNDEGVETADVTWFRVIDYIYVNYIHYDRTIGDRYVEAGKEVVFKPEYEGTGDKLIERWKVCNYDGEEVGLPEGPDENGNYSYIFQEPGEYFVRCEMFKNEEDLHPTENTSTWVEVLGGRYITELRASAGYEGIALGEEVCLTPTFAGQGAITSAVLKVEKLNEENCFDDYETITLDVNALDVIRYTPTEFGEYSFVLEVTNDLGCVSERRADNVVLVYGKGIRLDGSYNMVSGEKLGDVYKRTFSTVGTGKIESLYYTVLYSTTNDFYSDGTYEVYTDRKLDTKKNLTYSFTPKKAGYYLIKAELTNDVGYTSETTAWCTVSDLGFPSLKTSSWAIDLGDTITFTAKLSGKNPPKELTYEISRYDIDWSRDDPFDYWSHYGDPVTVTGGTTFSYQPTQEGKYYVCAYVVDALGVEVRNYTNFEVKAPDVARVNGCWLQDAAGANVKLDDPIFGVGEPITVGMIFDPVGTVDVLKYQIVNSLTGEDIDGKCLENPEGDSFTVKIDEAGDYTIRFLISSNGTEYTPYYVWVHIVDEHIHRYKTENVTANAATEDAPGNKAYSFKHCVLEGCMMPYADMKGKTMSETAFEEWVGTTQTTYVTATGVNILYEDETVNGETLTFDLAGELDRETGKRAEPITKFNLYAQVLPGMGANQRVIWSSSNTKVAKVDSVYGTVTLGTPGTAKITAKTEDGKKSASVTIVVKYKYEGTKLVIRELGETSLKSMQKGDCIPLYIETDKGPWVNPEELDITVTANGHVEPNVEGGVANVIRLFGDELGTVTVTATLKGNDPLKRKATYTAKVIPPIPYKASAEWAENAGAELDELGYIMKPGFEWVSAEGVYVLHQQKNAEKQVYTLTLTGQNDELGLKDYHDFTWKASGKGASVKMDTGTGEATITVNANAVGVTTLTATAKSNPDLTVTVKVIVVDYTPKLAANKVTLNAALESPSAVIDVKEVAEDPVTAVHLYEYDKASKTYKNLNDGIVSYNDTTKEVTITCASTADTGSRKVMLELETKYHNKTSALVTVTIQKTVPKVTVKQLGKVNLQRMEIGSQLAITVPNGVEIDEVMMSVPGYKLISNGEGGYSIIARNGATLKNNKGTIQIKAKGYGDPVYNKAITIAVENTPIAKTLNSYENGSNVHVYNPKFVTADKITGIKFGKKGFPNANGEITLDDQGFLRVNQPLDAGTYVIDIQATQKVENEQPRTFTSQVKLTVKNVLPSVTIKQKNKLNLQALGCESELQITAKVGKVPGDVKKVTLDGCGYTVEKHDGRFWLVPGKDVTAKKGTLTIQVAGYRPFTKAITVATESKATAMSLNTYLTEKNFILPMLGIEKITGFTVKLKNVDKTDKFAIEMTDAGLSFSAREQLPNGTYNATITALAENERTITCQVNVTVKNTLPAVTVKQIQKDNLSDPRGYAVFEVTSKNNTVEKITGSGGDYKCFTYKEKVDQYFTFTEHRARSENRDKPNTSVKMEIWLEGYDVPVTKTVKIATEKAAKKLTVNRAPVLYKEMTYFDVAVPLVTNYMGTLTFSMEKTYDWLDCSIKGNSLIFKFKEDAELPAARSYPCTITPKIVGDDIFGEDTVFDAIEIMLTVEEKPTVIISPTTATVSKKTGSTTVSVKDYYDLFHKDVTFEVEEKFAKDLTVTNNHNGKLTLALTEETTFKPGSYKVKLNPVLPNAGRDENGEPVALALDPITITVKVTK